jgi:hypothetical protein
MLRKMDARDASMPVPCSCVILAGFSKRRYLRPGELQVEARPRAEACGRDSDPRTPLASADASLQLSCPRARHYLYKVLYTISCVKGMFQCTQKIVQRVI